MNTETIKKEEEKYYYTFLDIYDYTFRVCVKLEYKNPPDCIGNYSVFEIKEVLNDDSDGFIS